MIWISRCRLLRELVKARQEVNQLLQQSVEEQQLLLENAHLTAAHRDTQDGKKIDIINMDGDQVWNFFIEAAVAKVLDSDLEVWLKGCGLDKPTIDKVVIASKIHNKT